ncbi:hypothetical protein H0266_01510 [Halobacillus locisalis]|uniref:Uncharacterized protein n=1 Tax=Halobacillus locisalis TaxID=220753 RepID=A0A838CP03_9BACI|nr:hypothetical protein [Halobacillus locisalis]MBA2173569.1 hypothetical protein [Halobacillus locisalis]
MADQRKQTIVNEIRYWKKNRLLPSEYCDFLLALYTEGEGEAVEDNQKATKYRKRLPWIYLFLALNLILLPLSFLVIYFTEMDIIMQTGLLSSFVALALVHFWRMMKKESELYHIPLIVGLLIALLLSVLIIHSYWPNNWSTYGIVTSHCLLWLWIGRRLRLPYLLISSSIGIIVMLVFIVL